MSEEDWKRIITINLSAFPILHCHANKNTPLGKTIIRIMDPDVSPSLKIPPLEVNLWNLNINIF